MAFPALCLVLLLVMWVRTWPREFDSEVWKDAGREATTIRWRMVDDLLENHLKRGMTEAQVRDLIGDRWGGWLKPSWPFPWDAAKLYTDYDNGGRLVRAFIHTD